MRYLVKSKTNLEGKGDNLTLDKLAKKHNISLDQIKKEYQMGLKVEMEHTKDPSVASQISIDHLTELPDYYTKLSKMEGEMKKSKYLKRTGSPGNYKYFYTEGKESSPKDKDLEPPIPTAKFDASAYFTKTDDPNASVYSVLKDAPPEVKAKIQETEDKLKQITPTIDNHRLSGEGPAAVYTPERTKIHESIISKVFTSDRIASAMPEKGKTPTFKMLGGRGGCLSKDHEFLTESGWKPISKYHEGDKVLTFDPESQTSKFEDPERYIDLPCDNFYHIKSRGLDLMVSEEHKILYYKKFNPEKYRNITAVDLYNKDKSLKEGWDGMIPCSFPGPDNTKGVNLSDDELRLMIAICADGNYSLETTNMCRISLRKERKKERLEYLLRKCGIDYKIYWNENRPTEERYSFYAPENNKTLSKYWDASKKQLSIISEEVIKWDGWTDKYKAWVFSSTRKEDIDFVSYVFNTQGRRSSFYKDDREGTGWSPIWRVSAGVNDGAAGIRGSKEKIEIVPSENGRKYCFTVSTGYFITRRNDCICITGNSGKSWFEGQVYDPKKEIVLDADAIKAQLPEYEGWNAFEVHEESSDILETMVAMAKSYGLNVVIDATMKTTGSAVERVKDFKESGYDIKCHYMHCPRQISAQRAVKRFGGASGRYVPVGVVLSNTSNEKTFDAVKEYASSWSFHDSSGNPPPELVSKKNGAMNMSKSIYEESKNEKSNPDPYDEYDFGKVVKEKDYSDQTKKLIEKFAPKEKKMKKSISKMIAKVKNITNPAAEYDRAYKLQDRIQWHGLDIAIENKKGSYRSGKDQNGKPWKTLMNYDYGRIGGTKGADGEHQDCYIGPYLEADMVYVVHQNDPLTDRWDEDKSMIGYVSKESAIEAYLSQYDNPLFLGPVSEFTIPEFKEALKGSRGAAMYRSQMQYRSPKYVVRKG